AADSTVAGAGGAVELEQDAAGSLAGRVVLAVLARPRQGVPGRLRVGRMALAVEECAAEHGAGPWVPRAGADRLPRAEGAVAGTQARGGVRATGGIALLAGAK